MARRNLASPSCWLLARYCGRWLDLAAICHVDRAPDRRLERHAAVLVARGATPVASADFSKAETIAKILSNRSARSAVYAGRCVKPVSGNRPDESDPHWQPGPPPSLRRAAPHVQRRCCGCRSVRGRWREHRPRTGPLWPRREPAPQPQPVFAGARKGPHRSPTADTSGSAARPSEKRRRQDRG